MERASKSISHNLHIYKEICFLPLTPFYWRRYTQRMKYRRIAAALLCIISILLAACSPGHLGNNVIAFIRNGQLWTIDPDGANAFAVVAQQPAVISYAWSPDHHLLTFRQLDPDFAKTATASTIGSNPVTGQMGDLPSSANTIGVDGGSPITIAFSSPDISYSAAQWSPSGTRLLYRQTSSITASTNPLNVHWWISQNDQPGGIAIKSFPNSYSIPSISYDANNYMIAGNSQRGIFTTSLAGTNLRMLEQPGLAGHPLPASLERVLWQPAHQNSALLYALPAEQSQTAAPLKIRLLLRQQNAQVTQLATCTCTQFAWSPDGNNVLYATGSTYTVLNIKTHSTFAINGEFNSVPYWSPNSQLLVLNGQQKLTLANITTRQQATLLAGNNNSATGQSTLPATSALLQPVSNNIWAADSLHFLFATQQHLLWQSHALSNEGLYTVTIDKNGKPLGQPTLVDKGNDTQAGWTYQDPNTSFLY